MKTDQLCTSNLMLRGNMGRRAKSLGKLIRWLTLCIFLQLRDCRLCIKLALCNKVEIALFRLFGRRNKEFVVSRRDAHGRYCIDDVVPVRDKMVKACKCYCRL